MLISDGIRDKSFSSIIKAQKSNSGTSDGIKRRVRMTLRPSKNGIRMAQSLPIGIRVRMTQRESERLRWSQEESGLLRKKSQKESEESTGLV